MKRSLPPHDGAEAPHLQGRGARRGEKKVPGQAQVLCKEKHTTGLMYAWADQKVPDLGAKTMKGEKQNESESTEVS